jgi:hypothetical protein
LKQTKLEMEKKIEEELAKLKDYKPTPISELQDLVSKKEKEVGIARKAIEKNQTHSNTKLLWM